MNLKNNQPGRKWNFGRIVKTNAEHYRIYLFNS
jgi:hypothetical protein